MAYDKLITENIVPSAVDHIGVYNASDERIGNIALGGLSTDYSSEKLYSFGLLSDVHNSTTVASENTLDMQRAGEWFDQKENIEFVACCGDITEQGTEADYQLFQTNVSTYFTVPFYTCSGNHDATTAGLNTTHWTTYTGCEKNFVINKTHTDSQNNEYVDHFIFFSMTTWSLGNSGTPYSTADINWLRQQLDTYRNERCFVFTHLFFPECAGNLNEIYPSGNWLGGSQLTTLQEIRDIYTNAHWFSGHSHWKWYTQEYQSKANIYKPNSSSGYTIHVPSLAKPIDSDGSSREMQLTDAEGGVVDVYPDHIEIRGIELKDGKFVPIAQYRLDTTLVDLGASKLNIPSGFHAITADMFSKFLTSSRPDGHSVTANDDGSITCTFTSKSQNFRIWNPEWGAVADNAGYTATLYSENVVFDPEQTSTAKQYIGCYIATEGANKGTYSLVSNTSGLKISDEVPDNADECTGGIEFNTSSRFTSANGAVLPASVTFTNLAFRIDK